MIDSQALTENPLGDPHRRPLWVWTPPGYERQSDARYPVIYRLQSFPALITTWRNQHPFRADPVAVADRALSDGSLPQVLVVYVDAWTSVGGSQYLDSPGTGRYHTYLCEEVVAFVDRQYRTLAAPEHRALTGHSSGGYGAMVTALLRPELFGAFASHSGDALFEYCYLADVRRAARALRDRYAGRPERFLKAVRTDELGRVADREGSLLNTYAMAACYSADADGTVQLPFDRTGRMRDEVWQRWLAWDPVRMVRERGAVLREARGIWVDAGTSDDYYLDLGAQAFVAGLREARVSKEVIAFELFDGGHGGVEWRYPLALRWLAERIAP